MDPVRRSGKRVLTSDEREAYTVFDIKDLVIIFSTPKRPGPRGCPSQDEAFFHPDHRVNGPTVEMG